MPMKPSYVAAVLFLTLPALSQNLPMFRGSLQHTGVYDSPPVQKFTAIKWKFHTAGQVISSPAISAGTAYVGSTDGNLYAIDVASGTQKWKFPTEVRITSSPAVDQGLVYFGSFNGNFYAVTAADGKLKWKFHTAEHRFTAQHIHGIEPAGESMPDPFDFYLSSPAVWNGTVYFGSGDGNVYALDAALGNLKWKFQTGDVVHASPAISDGVLFVGSWDSYFYALDATSGKEKWRFKTGEDPQIHNQQGIQSSAAIVGGVVYFGCRDSNLYALDAATGQKKWAFNNKGSWVIGSPAVQNGKIYFGTSDSSMFYGLDAVSGAQLFSHNFKWLMFSSPSIAGDMLYVGTHEGKLIAVDLKSQQPAWEFQTDASKQNGPTYTNAEGRPNYPAAFHENFYDDMVVGVSKLLTMGAILSSPVIVDGVIYFGSTDGNLYALQ